MQTPDIQIDKSRYAREIRDRYEGESSESLLYDVYTHRQNNTLLHRTIQFLANSEEHIRYRVAKEVLAERTADSRLELATTS